MSNKTKKKWKYSELKGGSDDFLHFLLEKCLIIEDAN